MRFRRDFLYRLVVALGFPITFVVQVASAALIGIPFCLTFLIAYKLFLYVEKQRLEKLLIGVMFWPIQLYFKFNEMMKEKGYIETTDDEV